MKIDIVCVLSNTMKVIVSRKYMGCVVCMGQTTNADVIISRNPKEKRRLRRSRLRLKNNIKVDLI